MRLRTVFVALALLLVQCDRDAKVGAVKAASGLGGVAFAIPRDYETAEHDGELRVYQPSRERGRSPVSIILTLSSEAPDERGSHVRTFGERQVHFTISTEEGGSGGEALRLKAWTTVSRGLVVVDSIVQPDVGGDPEFAAEWGILSTLR